MHTNILRAAIFSALIALLPSSANCAWTWVYFSGSNRFGHEFTLIDSHGGVAPLGVMDGMYTACEYRNSVTNEVAWISGNPAFSFSDPENWYETGAWHIVAAELNRPFNELTLTLNAGTQYYLYDNNTNQYSLPASFSDDTYSYIEFQESEMRDSWPSLPIQTIGGGLKVFGKATYFGKTRFDAPVRIAPAGDLSMGEFTHEPAF